MRRDAMPAYSRIYAMDAHLKSFGDPVERNIQGTASTPALDRQREIVRPEAMLEGLSEFLSNPLMSWNHEWWEPIGTWPEAEVTSEGLSVRGRLMKEGDPQTDKAWRRIDEGVVKTLSIGFNPRGDKPGHVDKDSGVYVWDCIQLMEIAVTPLPANPEATFSLAKSLGLSTEPPVPLFRPLPLADVDWEPVEAAKRLREAGHEDAPEFADFIDGQIVAVWRGVQAAMAAAKGLRGNPDTTVRAMLGTYYEQRGEAIDDAVTPHEKAAFEEAQFTTNITDARGRAISAANIIRHWSKEGRVLSAGNRSKVEQARDALDAVLQADAASRESRGLPVSATSKRNELHFAMT